MDRYEPDNRAAQDKNGLTVVGVVGDIRDFKLEQPASPQLFQHLSDDQTDAYVVVRSLLPPKDVAAADAAILHRIDPSLGFTEVRTMREVISDSTARRRFQTMVLTIFSAMAFVLAMVGLYGLITYSVRERRPEMGVRIALGATRGHVLRRVVRQGLQLVTSWALRGVDHGAGFDSAVDIVAVWSHRTGSHHVYCRACLAAPDNHRSLPDPSETSGERRSYDHPSL